MRLSDIKLAHKFTFMLIPIIVGFLIFICFSTYQKYIQYQQYNSITSLVKLATKNGQVVHELQKERGMSAGYIGSQGKVFKNRLPAKYQQTDQAIADYKTAAKIILENNNNPGLQQNIHSVTNLLDQIKALRQQVGSLSISTQTAIARYSEMNQKLFALTSNIIRLSTDDEINKSANTYLNFIEAKEFMGIERAVVTIVFAKKQVSQQQLIKLTKLIEAQDSFLKASTTTATAGFLAQLQALQNHEISKAVNQMRDIVMTTQNDKLANIKPTHWFDTITKKINLFYQAELKQAQSIENSAIKKANLERNALLLQLTISFLILFFSIIAAVFIARSIKRRIRHLVKLSKEISQGNLDNDIGQIRLDELGMLLSSLSDMQTELKQQRKVEQRRNSYAMKRVTEALNNATSAVLLADSDLMLCYANLSAKSLFEKYSDSLLQQGFPDVNKIADSTISLSKLIALSQGHDTQALANLNKPTVYSVQINSMFWTVRLIPIIDDEKQLGIAVEVVDETAEKAIQIEIKQVIDATVEGDLEKTLDLNNKEGFLHDIAAGINKVTSTNRKILSDLSHVLEAMAKGDLTQEIREDYEGQYKVIKENANKTIVQLTDTISKIKESCLTVDNNSLEIAKSNMDISQRTEEQANSLNQVSMRVQEFSENLKKTAKQTKETKELAQEAETCSNEGGNIIQKVISSMSTINESSNQIADIVGVIDEIAFQTNLLALNAAVEAARAGEQGRGFAVVATEVRELAQRSANSAKEIKQLIDNSVDKIRSGSDFVSQSGDALSQILKVVQSVNENIADIETVVQQQSDAIEGITETMDQMDHLTQQNTALVEETAATSQLLGDKSKEMIQFVNVFSLNKDFSLSAAPKLTVANDQLNVSAFDEEDFDDVSSWDS